MHRCLVCTNDFPHSEGYHNTQTGKSACHVCINELLEALDADLQTLGDMRDPDPVEFKNDLFQSLNHVHWEKSFPIVSEQPGVLVIHV